jgi:hypothetical protein
MDLNIFPLWGIIDPSKQNQLGYIIYNIKQAWLQICNKFSTIIV